MDKNVEKRRSERLHLYLSYVVLILLILSYIMEYFLKDRINHRIFLVLDVWLAGNFVANLYLYLKKEKQNYY